MAHPKTNMLQREPYRKRLKVGDVFQLEFPESRFVVGRVMSLSASAGGFDDCILIYVYKTEFTMAEVPEDLDSCSLLCQPLFINRLGFSRGYMPVVGHVAITDLSRRSEWCFHSIPFNKFFDEQGVELDSSTDYVGTWGLSNYLVLDDLVSERLGIEPIGDDS
ncbi:immunity 26/phosphotriesterase HocA family protein [Marinobacter hydrocarbonoclasticus]|nr:immunity 26/phosphotriesterase HocA family protein [Marinobacter nauticus]